MADTFMTNKGCCTDNHSIDIAIDLDWLLNPNLILSTIEGLMIQNIPIISFNAKGRLYIKDRNL